MKKLILLFLSVLTAGSLFQACDDSKTYAEMLEDEKNAVEKFISDSTIHVISMDEFVRNDSVTKSKARGDAYDEYVLFSGEGVYMQIIDAGEPNTTGENHDFVDGDEICVRYMEKDITTREVTCFNVATDEWMDASQLYSQPAVFRYVKQDTYLAGTFTQMDYYWASYYQSTAVPQGWLLALPYVRDDSHVRLIIPSKMGHQSAQQYVTPFFYDIWTFSKAKS